MTTGSSELKWYKSSYSTNDGPECVEVAATPHTIHIRDSKNTHGPRLAFTPDRWTAFVTFAVTSSPS
ncbi:DUF397 domain-containing protein [Streptomyces fagopyri]|uniref:DUF397 domain-containing protein n=1 Tax=Streptomyces fagopyri TaxID=2662397 RepID=UPI0033D1C942